MKAFAGGLAIVLAVGCSDAAGERGPLLPPGSDASTIAIGDMAGAATMAAQRNPYASDAIGRTEGGRLFREMNCVDCHGYSAEGLMGPSLIDDEWLFGDTPSDKFLSIYSGRTRGMPAFGHLLPDESIWKIVAYLDQLAKDAGTGRFGEPARRGGGDAARSVRDGQSSGMNRR